MNAAAEDVLSYWFGELPREKWFAKDAAVDAEIARRFGDLHECLSREVPASWRDSPPALLAAIIVLDQFSRNLRRDDARAYANDSVALGLAKEALERGFDAGLSRDELHFLYMPFMHAEDLAEQDRSVALFRTLGDPGSLDFAERHRVVIASFGRFPQRNAPLGRESTPAEIEFLRRPGSAF